MKNLKISFKLVLFYPNWYYLRNLLTIGCHLIQSNNTNAHLTYTKVGWAFVSLKPSLSPFNDA
jgi:hypothetical protein